LIVELGSEDLSNDCGGCRLIPRTDFLLARQFLITFIKERRTIMAFRDLFLPKIAHSNPEVRIKAVKGEKDKALLQRVIENDQDPEVVKTAKKRIEELTA
jgi:hypothetical protein